MKATKINHIATTFPSREHRQNVCPSDAFKTKILELEGEVIIIRESMHAKRKQGLAPIKE